MTEAQKRDIRLDESRRFYRAVSLGLEFDKCGFTKPTAKALIAADIDLKQLMAMSDDEVKDIPGLGKAARLQISTYRPMHALKQKRKR